MRVLQILAWVLILWTVLSLLACCVWLFVLSVRDWLEWQSIRRHDEWRKALR